MAGDRASVPISELDRLRGEAARPDPLTDDEIQDTAVAGLMVLRGLRRADKFKVLRKMRKLMG